MGFYGYFTAVVFDYNIGHWLIQPPAPLHSLEVRDGTEIPFLQLHGWSSWQPAPTPGVGGIVWKSCSQAKEQKNPPKVTRSNIIKDTFIPLVLRGFLECQQLWAPEDPETAEEDLI